MGKNDDIIDSMFNTMLELFGWIFKQMFKLVVWLISTLFKLTWKLLGLLWNLIAKRNDGEETATDVSSGAQQQQSTRLYSYGDAVRDIENAQAESTEDGLEERYNYLFVNTVLNGNISVDEKCRALELLNDKIKTYSRANPLIYGRFYVSALDVSFKMLDQMYDGKSMMVSGIASDFRRDLENAQLKDFNTYLADILAYSGLLHSQNGKFSLESETLQKYDLPTFVLS